jgi:hypothetical protein
MLAVAVVVVMDSWFEVVIDGGGNTIRRESDAIVATMEMLEMWWREEGEVPRREGTTYATYCPEYSLSVKREDGHGNKHSAFPSTHPWQERGSAEKVARKSE